MNAPGSRRILEGQIEVLAALHPETRIEHRPAGADFPARLEIEESSGCASRLAGA